MEAIEKAREIRKYLSELFSDIRFDEERHLYFVNGEQMPSVSKKLEDHYEKFDEAVWLPRVSKRDGIPIEELRAQWREKNRVSTEDVGTPTHNYLEKVELNHIESTDKHPEWIPWYQLPSNEYLADLPQKKAGMQFLYQYIFPYKPRYYIVAVEYRMCHRTFKFCGTCDLILWDSWEDTFILVDWKTNSDLFKTYGHLKPPFDYYQSNPFNKYQLQFTYYQIMFEQCKYKIKERWLVYLENTGNHQIHKTQYMADELTTYLLNPVQEDKPAGYGFSW